MMFHEDEGRLALFPRSYRPPFVHCHELCDECFAMEDGLAARFHPVLLQQADDKLLADHIFVPVLQASVWNSHNKLPIALSGV